MEAKFSHSDAVLISGKIILCLKPELMYKGQMLLISIVHVDSSSSLYLG